MTRMTGPERAVMCNLINIHTHIHTYVRIMLQVMHFGSVFLTFSNFHLFGNIPTFEKNKRKNKIKQKIMCIVYSIIIKCVRSRVPFIDLP